MVFILMALISWLVSGCGGSGADRSTALSGTVTDVAGNLIPGATIEVEETRASTRSLMNGTFKFQRVSTRYDWVNLHASATIDGSRWVGLRATQVFADGPTQNVNIVMAPVSRMGEISGNVRDVTGNAIAGARVFATANFPHSPDIDENPGQVTLTTVADSAGRYRLTNVPANVATAIGVQSVIYRVTASSAGRTGQQGGFDNATEEGVTLPAGGEARVNFVLAASVYEDLLEPEGWTDWNATLALSFTLPSEITTRSYQAYRGVMATISPKMRDALAARTVTRVPPPGSIIEINVLWNWFDWTWSNDNLAGFGIYRRANARPTISDRDQLDFVRVPDLVTYSDTSNTLSVGIDYYYGVTAISTSYLDALDLFNPDSESRMSGVSSVRPIGQLRLISPASNSVVGTSRPLFSWQLLSGARAYQLIIYNDYPIFEVSTSPGSPNRPVHLPDYVTVTTTTTSARPDVTLAPGTYWWTVIAGDEVDLENEATAYSIGELRQLRVSY